jgi:dihydropteroate synthase
MLGASRKSFLGILNPESLGTTSPPSERLAPTAATTAWAISRGVDMLRVHDVRPAVQAVYLASGGQPVANAPVTAGGAP